MPDNVFFGLDNTQPGLLRVVSVLVEKPFATSVFSWARCNSSQQFEAFAATNFTPNLVATSNVTHDPCDAIAWMNQRRIPVHRSSALGRFHPSDLDQQPDLPKTYRRAYSLAIRAAYKYEAPRALEYLSFEIQLARNALERLEQTANNLYDYDAVPF
jgi:hypothetical protein